MQAFKFCQECATQNERDAEACAECGAHFTSPDEWQKPLRVVVVDFDMKFGSMITFMIKWTLASIPAILAVILGIATVLGYLGRLLRAIP